MNEKGDDKYSAKETERRAETALRAAFSAPHKTYEESKVGKRKRKPTESPGKDKPVKK